MLIGKDKTYRTRLISGNVGLLNNEIYYYQNLGDFELLVNDKDTIIGNTSAAISLQKGILLNAKTPTFIPSQYIVADSIQIPTTGYINTNISAIPRYTRSEFKIKWQGSSTGTRGLYGVRGAAIADNKAYNVYLTVSGVGPRWDNTGSSGNSSNWSVGETHTVELTHSGNYGQTIVDGDIVATGTVDMDTTSYSSIYLNSVYTASTSAVATGGTVRWYSCKIWSDGTTLSGNFVPVYDTVGQEAGMYDLVTKSFFGNSGSSTIDAYDAEGNVITG